MLCRCRPAGDESVRGSSKRAPDLGIEVSSCVLRTVVVIFVSNRVAATPPDPRRWTGPYPLRFESASTTDSTIRDLLGRRRACSVASAAVGSGGAGRGPSRRWKRGEVGCRSESPRQGARRDDRTRGKAMREELKSSLSPSLGNVSGLESGGIPIHPQGTSGTGFNNIPSSPETGSTSFLYAPRGCKRLIGRGPIRRDPGTAPPERGAAGRSVLANRGSAAGSARSCRPPSRGPRPLAGR